MVDIGNEHILFDTGDVLMAKKQGIPGKGPTT